jgi:glycosyltransferase involved in cell wall biosynthesis
MHIVHIVVGKVNPDSLNGVSKMVHGMATSQTELGHSVEVWGLAKSTTPSRFARTFWLRLFPMTRLRVVPGRKIRAAIDELEDGTWVQFHSVFCPEFPALARLLRRRGIAYGVTPHGGYAPGIFRKNPLAKRLYFLGREAKYLASATWFQAIGATEAEELKCLVGGAEVVLIPNCQSVEPRRMPVTPAHAERPLVGYCGRLAIQQKGIDILIAGFAAYRANGGRGELWLIGDGAQRETIEQQARTLGQAQTIRFLGARHGEEKLNLIASLDVFIHTSRWDVIPTACLEAAALGRPLVVSRETNLGEYVRRADAGLILDELSAAGVMRALLEVDRLHKDGLLEEMGENGRRLVQSDFSWESHARSFVAAVRRARHAI